MKTFLTALLLVAIAICASCSKKPHITSLVFGASENAQPPVTSFDIHDGIHVVASTENITPKQSLYFSVTTEKVAERENGSEVMTKLVDLATQNPARLYFSVAYPGEYKVEATLNDENNKPLDTKSGVITVTGEAPPLEVEHEGVGEPDKDRDHDKDRDRERFKEKGGDKDKNG